MSFWSYMKSYLIVKPCFTYVPSISCIAISCYPDDVIVGWKMHLQYIEQRWAKGPIDRSSDTDSIFRLYRTIQSVDAKFRFLYRPIVSVRFEFRFFNRPILFFGFKFRFLYPVIVSPVLSNKKNALKMMGNWLAGPSKMDFVETIRLLYVRFINFEG